MYLSSLLTRRYSLPSWSRYQPQRPPVGIDPGAGAAAVMACVISPLFLFLDLESSRAECGPGKFFRVFPPDPLVNSGAHRLDNLGRYPYAGRRLDRFVEGGRFVRLGQIHPVVVRPTGALPTLGERVVGAHTNTGAMTNAMAPNTMTMVPSSTSDCSSHSLIPCTSLPQAQGRTPRRAASR